MSFFEHLLNNKVLLCVLILAVASVIHFIAQYAVRGIALRRELMKIAGSIRKISPQPQAELKNKLGQIFSTTRLCPSWEEFEETLHEQHEWVDGEKRTTAVRATVPAEAFFNDASAIEPWLGSEYFKHLPGILTGMGIIGTFLGLIHGLQGFAPDTDATDIQRSLGNLFDNVGLAFRFSAFAISAAIIITGVEKWLYASCSKWVRELSQAVDALFRPGVGEEYLSSLVQASHASAAQGKQLKESLVGDFRELLTNLTERQIAATRQLSLDISQRLQQSLQEPLDKIAATVRLASGQQQENVAALLEKLMTSFMAQMRETMGAQLGDLGNLLRQSSESMARVETAMRSLLTDMQRNSQESSASTQAAIKDLLSSFAEQQRAVAAGASGSVEKLGAGVSGVADAIDKLALVTDRLAALASRLAALEGSSAQGVHALLEATQGLGIASQSLAGVIEQLGNTGTRLESVARASVMEAKARGELIRDLREVSARTLQAALEFKALADQVRTSVSDSVNHFGSSMSQTVAQHMQEYQKQLGDAVGMLSGALQELAEYAESSKR